VSVYIEPRKTKRGRSFHVRWRPRGETRHVHCGAFDTEHRAVMRREAVKDLLARGITPSLDLLEPRATPREDLLGVVAERWVDSKVRWASSTREVREGYVRCIVAHFGAFAPSRITVEDVREWVARMIRDGIQGTTIAARMTTLRCILDEAGVVPNVARDKRIELPKAKARRRPLPTQEQLDAIRVCLNEHDRRILAILEHGGLRLSEAVLLEWEQVDNAKDRLIDVGTKGKTTRVVERLAFQPSWIPMRHPDTFGRIFQGDGDQFYARLRHACERAGVARINPHLLRHLHASRLEALRGREHDLGLAAMAERMGHSQQQFLLTYNHRMPD
jgi:integrase